MLRHPPILDSAQRMLAPLASVAVLLAACGGSDQQSTTDGASVAQASQQSATIQAATENAVCFYEHVDYKGQSFCADASNNWLDTTWNDKASSVKIKAGYKVELFEHVNFGGRSVTLTGDTANLVNLGFNDLASSLKITAPTVTNGKVANIQLAQSLLFNSDDSALVLVAGKAALVKVNVTTTDPNAAKPSGTLRVENTNGGGARDLLLTPPTSALPTSTPQVPNFNDSYTVLLPADLVKPGLRLTVTIGNGAATTLSPRVGGGTPMKLIPIAVQIAGVTGKLPVNQAAHVQALFPVSSVASQNHSTYVSSRVKTLPTNEDAWGDAFGKILGELADLHSLEGAAKHDHYFGFIPKRTWGLAGLAYLSGNSGVGFDMPDSPNTVRDVVAHELGHNFSLPHAACGGAGSPDPKYPYPDANLGKTGRYVWPFLADNSTFYDPRPTNRHDIMSYCGGVVFSDYNYRQMQVYLTPSDRMVVTEAAQALVTDQELLLISGEIGKAGVELNPVKSLVGKADLPTAGSYTLRIVSANGTVDYPFAPRQLDHASSVQHFGFTIPNPGVIQSVTVVQNDKTLLNAQAKATNASGRERAQAAVSQAQVQEANGNVKLSWNASEHPFATVTWVGEGQRRNLAQDLRSGTATLSTADLPAGGSFEVILSDGLNATRLSHSR